jgi:4-hydroxybenzoate polyprenyltransferase
MSKLYALFKALRPNQWIKNLLVFAGIIFSKHFFDLKSIGIIAITFFLFCFISGFIYVINDIKDIEIDKMHPAKKNRAIASGKIKPATAIIFSLPLAILSLIVAYFINIWLVIVLGIYLLLNILYSVWLKKIVILDIMIVASGFLLRAIGGVVAINIELTHWFAIAIYFLALIMAAGKRRHEYQSNDDDRKKRAVIEHYSLSLIDQIICISSALAIITYSLYTVLMYEHESIPYLYLTIPFVLFGIFRYLFIVFKRGEGENPEKIFIKDFPTVINVILYIITLLCLSIFSTQR